MVKDREVWYEPSTKYRYFYGSSYQMEITDINLNTLWSNQRAYRVCKRKEGNTLRDFFFIVLVCTDVKTTTTILTTTAVINGVMMENKSVFYSNCEDTESLMKYKVVWTKADVDLRHVTEVRIGSYESGLVRTWNLVLYIFNMIK